MLEAYKTVLHVGSSEVIEKKSKFIANISPVEAESEAQDFIAEIRKKYYDANHNVFAYQIGERNQFKRCSDDGEPSGTAGVPILDILKAEDIKNVVVVVTRFFGGTLLGTGGLVRAYSKAAKEGLLNAEIIKKVACQEFKITVDYELLGKIQYELLNHGYIISDILYDSKVTFIVLSELQFKSSLKEMITEITSARACIVETQIVYNIVKI